MKTIHKIINWFYRKKEVRLSKKQINELMSEVRQADFNYERFPPKKSVDKKK